ncbi:MAG TPA: hypothetical protein GXZ20_07835 [Halanaerobiaceae bacterium]|jgi:hypothetical protein|nr:hypothetical protein [Bacillota bacterium]HHU93023.1 hypothetical protein [Halanaerobiaceae bacterium]HOA40214.1 hypothetical protein [Halanaerobiales bacterium]HPZ62367.1 hypothetical protein [Halanaerobiales bacterium]HQD03765.1 hypothetical protein [Halanaerobiales bacterium]
MSENNILAIITTKKLRDKVAGGAPIFFADNEEEVEELSSLLARITLAMVHDLENGIKIIVRH